MFVWNKIRTQSYSTKFLYWGDHVNSVPGLAATPPALASLLGAVNDLTTGLNEVKADNQHLRALIAKNSTNDDHEVVEATPGHSYSRDWL